MNEFSYEDNGFMLVVMMFFSVQSATLLSLMYMQQIFGKIIIRPEHNLRKKEPLMHFRILVLELNSQNGHDNFGSMKKRMRSPGIEPGSITWQATIITTRPRTRNW